jgi:Mn2+/Fe2+ NRAMP family transporter
MNKLAISAGSLSGIGTLGNPSGGATTMAKIISSAIGIMTVIGVIYFLFVLITGAIAIIGSGGDKGGFEEGRRKITTGVIGLVVTISAMFILDIITVILGFPDFLNLNAMINSIRVQ